MRAIHHFSKSLASLALVVSTIALASNAFAAGLSGHGGGFGGGSGSGHFGGRGGADRFVNSAVPMQAPVFNPSEHYTVTQSPEAPVSPGSPGSIFGDR